MTAQNYNFLGQLTQPVTPSYRSSIPFSSGLTLTIAGPLTGDTTTPCTSTTAGAKTVTVPTSVGSLCRMTFNDNGSVATGNVTITPVSGSITGLSVLNTVGMSLTIEDGASGWSSV